MSSNQVNCWGNNASLQLNSVDAGSFTPSPVATLTNIATVAAGANHARRSTRAATSILLGRQLVRPARNERPDDRSRRELPSPSPSALKPELPDWRARFAAGGSATCAALLDAGAIVECWGANEHGQLGHDPATDSLQSCPGNGGPCQPINIPRRPVAIDAIALAMGPTATCAIKSDQHRLVLGLRLLRRQRLPPTPPRSSSPPSRSRASLPLDATPTSASAPRA